MGERFHKDFVKTAVQITRNATIAPNRTAATKINTKFRIKYFI
jgi:hypothetical protein